MSGTTYISMTFEIPQNNTELILPLVSFSGTIDWGNGTTQNYLSNTNSPSITYTLLGTYTVKLIDVINCSSFTNINPSFQNYLTDFSYLIKIQTLTDLSRLFSNCSKNFTINFKPDVTNNVTNMSSMFMNTLLFNQEIDLNCDVCTTFKFFLYGSINFNSSVTLTNTSKVTNMENMFQGMSEFNQNISLDCLSCTSLSSFLDGASKFNSTLDLRNTQKVMYMDAVFNNANYFNQPINLDCSSCVSISSFLANARSFNNTLNLTPIPKLTNKSFNLSSTNLSSTNYSNLLILWGGQTVSPNVNLNATGIKYNNQALPYRNILTSVPNNWIIQDNGLTQQTTTITGVQATQTKAYGDAPFNLTYSSNNPSTPTYSSSKINVVTINQSGLVTVLSPGQTTLTISLPENSNYDAASATCVLNVEVNSPSYPANIASAYDAEYFLAIENATYGEIVVPSLQVTNLINSSSSSKQLTSKQECVLFI